MSSLSFPVYKIGKIGRESIKIFSESMFDIIFDLTHRTAKQKITVEQ